MTNRQFQAFGRFEDFGDGRGLNLIVDDGGYGILREYMVGAFGKATATGLAGLAKCST